MAEESSQHEYDTDVVVPLEPFIHQVAGHSCFMKFDDVSICKPLIPREHRVYEDLPSELRPFTPEYRGVAHVSFQEDDEGNIHVIAHPSSDKAVRKVRACRSCSSCDGDKVTDNGWETAVQPSPRTNLVDASIKKSWKHRVRIRSNHVETLPEGSGEESMITRKNSSSMADQGKAVSKNTWYLRCQKRNFKEMKAYTDEHKTHEFIILENIAYRYRNPCVLDLKIGTQQHGDDTPQEKIVRKMKKVASSTSSTLGVRIGGMQVFKASTHRLICRNKYDGQKLSVKGFKREICNFLHNGRRLAVELIEPFITKLRRLHRVIERQQSFRFFSSSLLLIYEGQEPISDLCEGDSARHLLSSVLCDNEEMIPTKISPCYASASTRKGKRAKTGECCWSGKYHTPHPRIDVRLIDFAHTTHSGFSEDRTRKGPDKGCLLGIRSTIQTLEEILKEHTTEGSCSEGDEKAVSNGIQGEG